MARGLLILALIWWAWGGYAWLTSTVDPEHALPRIVMFAAMGAMLVVALATPGAFGDDGVLWGIGYLAVRLLHAALFWLAGSGDRALRRQVLSLALSTVPGAGLVILAGAAFDGATRDWLWAAAVVFDYGIVLAFGVKGWRVHAEHFAERFALVVIIALGESIVAIGVGAEDVALGAGEIAAALVAVGIVCLLWWAYFDMAALAVEQRFRAAVGVEQLRIARDAYGVGHFPMIAGIVLFALGVKKVLEHTDDPLKAMPAVALCGGVALYALAHVICRRRSLRTVSRPRIVATVACAALIPVTLEVSGLVSLVLLAAVWAALIAYETVQYAEDRTLIRTHGHETASGDAAAA